jgi:hypothetical protein
MGLYAYVGANPLRWIDAIGLQAIPPLFLGELPPEALPPEALLPENQCPVQPRPTPHFEPPTNPPQLPPENIPAGWRIREMPPTEQYPNGYWRLEKPLDNGGWQPIDPSTMKPGTRPETHIPLPPQIKG